MTLNCNYIVMYMFSRDSSGKVIGQLNITGLFIIMYSWYNLVDRPAVSNDHGSIIIA